MSSGTAYACDNYVLVITEWEKKPADYAGRTVARVVSGPSELMGKDIYYQGECRAVSLFEHVCYIKIGDIICSLEIQE